MMNDPDLLLSLIELIYDASFNPPIWSEALQQAADLVKADCGVVEGFSKNDQKIIFTYRSQLDTPFIRVCSEDHRDDSAKSAQTPMAESLVGSEKMDPERACAKFSSRSPRGGFASCTTAELINDDHTRVTVTFCRSEKNGAFPETANAQLDELLPHLQRAMRLHMRFDAYANAGQDRQEMLDRLSTGLLILSDQGNVLSFNRTAKSLVIATSPRPEELAFSPNVADPLRRIIQAALDGDKAESAIIERQDSREQIAVIAIPLRGLNSGTRVLGHPAVVVFLSSSPSSQMPSLSKQLEQLFDLTSTEAGIALALGNGSGHRDVAQQAGIGQNTLKTHVRHIYAKMNIHRQAELVQLLSALQTIGVD